MKILEFLQEDSGALSSTRLLFLIWGIGGFVLWVLVSLRLTPPGFAPLSWEYIGVVLSLGGVKVVQKFGEKQPPPGT